MRISLGDLICLRCKDICTRESGRSSDIVWTAAYGPKRTLETGFELRVNGKDE
jgi:hypothetical protein